MPSQNDGQFSGFPQGYDPYRQPYSDGNSYNPNDPYDARIGNGSLPPGISGTQNRAYTRAVQGNELSGNHLNQLIDENNPYMQSAVARAAEMSGERGDFMSSAAAGSATRAAIDAAAPFAMQHADAFGRTASENMGALNERALADLDYRARAGDTAARLTIARLQEEGQLQRQREGLAFQGEQQGLDRSFTNLQNGLDRSFQAYTQRQQHTFGMQDYAFRTGIDMNAQRGIFYQNLWNAALQDPEMFPPEIVGGMFETWNAGWEDIESMFDPVFDDIFADMNFGGW